VSHRRLEIGANLYQELECIGFGEVEFYTGGDASPDVRIGRNAFGSLGGATQRVEIRGGMGQKSSGDLIQPRTAGRLPLPALLLFSRIA